MIRFLEAFGKVSLNVVISKYFCAAHNVTGFNNDADSDTCCDKLTDIPPLINSFISVIRVTLQSITQNYVEFLDE